MTTLDRHSALRRTVYDYECSEDAAILPKSSCLADSRACSEDKAYTHKSSRPAVRSSDLSGVLSIVLVIYTISFRVFASP